MFLYLLRSLIFILLLSGLPGDLHAAEAALQKINTQHELAQEFLSRMKYGFRNADAFMRRNGIKGSTLDLRGLPEGELLLFELLIPPRLRVEGAVIGEIRNNTVLLSLRDFIQILNFPITYNNETKTYTGWFIRENKKFNLDPASSVVIAEGQEYRLDDSIIFRDDDVLVPLSDIESWFNMDVDVDIGTQQLALEPVHPLPATEWFERRQSDHSRRVLPPPSLPRTEDGYDLIDFPHIDVSTRSTWRSRVNQKRTIDRQVNIRSAGEFAYGALNTSISANGEDKITNARISWLRESAHPELLGHLKARRFELGDISPTRLPLMGSAPPETGVRITNTDPLVRQTLPSTQIAGYIFSGWDVELYRENSLLSFRETGPDGYYSFDNVRLFSARNFFRVVAYGPQGEIREEAVNVPLDRNRVATRGGIYDVSVTMQDHQFYQKFDIKSEDKNTPHIVGFYETPVREKSALRLGIRYRQEEGEQKTYASAGLSTSYAGAMVNVTVAGDEQGELASEFVVRRQFGPHSFRGDLNLATDHYSPGKINTTVRILSNRYSLEGPFPYKLGDSPRYAVSLNYNQSADGESSYGGLFNLNTQFQRVGVNQILNYSDASTNENGPGLNGTSSVSGSFGENIVRGLARYIFNPDHKLDSLSAFWKRRINNELETQFQVDRTIEDGLTRYSAQLNWRPKYATITPRLSYDSEGNAEAVLSTSFGMARIPDSGDIVFTRDSFASLGAVSAFVFLDKDGDLEFNGEDEPIEGATIMTPHNGGGGETNGKGIAYIPTLRPNIITDVFLEQGSLSDPYWIPAHKGVSVMPRTGMNISLKFPVHLAGEMDGTVYVRMPDGSSRARGGVVLNLYNQRGMLEQTTTAAPDGFYIFTLVPPGQYILLIDADIIPANTARPLPQTIEIGYEGTIIYSNDIFMQAGTKDVPSTILASLDGYRARHPHISFDHDPDIVLNLGSYNSNLMMALAWYRVTKRHGSILSGSKLLVPPGKSFADIKSGQHTLRIALPEGTIDDAYARCRTLIAKDLFCEVEILPGALEKQMAQKHSNLLDWTVAHKFL